MATRRIPVAGPSITEKEQAYVQDAVAHAWYQDANRYHDRFERAFRERIGVKHAIALPSCTSALHLALLALGVGPGDEVIVPDLTWIATVAPVRYVGATPVFADVDPSTWCLSADSVERCLTKRTRAIIPVDLYGGMPDYRALRHLAQSRGVAIIEDAAEAVGSLFHGHAAGSLGTLGTFSFHGSKTITTGEGGMLVTDRDDLYQRALVLRDHGRAPGDRHFVNQEVAFKYKMSSMQAALGLAQLERLDALLAHRRGLYAQYRELLADVPGLTWNCEPSGTLNSFWMVTVVLEPDLGLSKTDLMERLDKRGIDSRPFFHPLSSLPAFREEPEARRAQERNVQAYRVSPWGVNLPSAATLTPDDVAFVCTAFRECLAEGRR